MDLADAAIEGYFHPVDNSPDGVFTTDAGFFLRASGTTLAKGYALLLRAGPNQNLSVAFCRVLSGTPSTATNILQSSASTLAIPYSGTDVFKARFTCLGTELRGELWRVSGATETPVELRPGSFAITQAAFFSQCGSNQDFFS